MTTRDLRRVSAFAFSATLSGALAAFSILPLAAQEAGVAPTPAGFAPPAAAPRAPGSAFQAGLAAALAEASPEARAAVLQFYADRGDAPFWSGADRAEALVAVLEGAAAQGLPPQRYQPEQVAAALAGRRGDPAAEAAAMQAWLSYGRDVSSGVLTPRRVDPEIEVLPRRPTPAALTAALGNASSGAEIAAAAARLAPQSLDYAALVAEKARLEAAGGDDWGPEVPAGPTLREGDSGPRVAALRARLAARGHAAAGSSDPAAFDAALARALAGFQADAGLEADGLAGKRTVAALNAGQAAALQAVLVNLERARWTNGVIESRYIYVNIPDFRMRLVEDGRIAFDTPVVVGRAEDTRTPEFSGEMTYMVVNPTWHIPDSIAQRVYLPKLKANPNTLADSGMRIFTRSGTEIDPALVDFKQFSQGNFPFRIKQNPSDDNALGKVKFMFPNQFAIYLHDTPNRALLEKPERAFSNGCIRVKNPETLADLLLAGQVADPAAAFEGWVAAKAEKTVNLARPIMVHIDYRTVFLDASGRLQRRPDVYGRDAEVWQALQNVGVTLPAAQG